MYFPGCCNTPENTCRGMIPEVANSGVLFLLVLAKNQGFYIGPTLNVAMFVLGPSPEVAVFILGPNPKMAIFILGPTPNLPKFALRPHW